MKDIIKRGAPKTTLRTPANTSADIANFLARAAETAPPTGEGGLLVFALDATMSRQPTWDAACSLQAEMFDEVGRAGGGQLEVQLVYFRSMSECRASRWARDTRTLADMMSGIQCRGGLTQIGKVLSHVRKEGARRGETGRRISALVYVGDAMEESVDALAHKAGELGLLGVPAFMFQEGRDATAENAFREIARLSRGAYMRFDAGAAAELGKLLRAVARYAAGGRKALAASGEGTDRKLLEQLK